MIDKVYACFFLDCNLDFRGVYSTLEKAIEGFNKDYGFECIAKDSIVVDKRIVKTMHREGLDNNEPITSVQKDLAGVIYEFKLDEINWTDHHDYFIDWRLFKNEL